MNRAWIVAALAACTVFEAGAAEPATEAKGTNAAAGELRVAPAVEARLARFAQVEIAADLTPLTEAERAQLADLIRAARELDAIFRRQVWAGNPALEARLGELAGAPGRAARESAADAARVSFEAFFNQTLHHELAHGLGPGTIVKDGRTTEVRLELKDHYSTLEEAKADVMGIYDILALIEKGDMPRELRAAVDPTYVAGLFRSARFGVHEAHGQGTVAQFNYLLEKGALALDADGRYRTVGDEFPDAIRALLHDMLALQAAGDYAGTQAFLERYGHATPPLLAAIERLGDLPVDLDTVFTQAGELTR